MWVPIFHVTEDSLKLWTIPWFATRANYLLRNFDKVMSKCWVIDNIVFELRFFIHLWKRVHRVVAVGAQWGDNAPGHDYLSLIRLIIWSAELGLVRVRLIFCPSCMHSSVMWWERAALWSRDFEMKKITWMCPSIYKRKVPSKSLSCQRCHKSEPPGGHPSVTFSNWTLETPIRLIKTLRQPCPQWALFHSQLAPWNKELS